MPSEPVLRFLLAAGLIIAAWAIYRLANRAILTSAASLESPSPRSGNPSIVYFTTPDCAPCRTVQRPAIQRLQQVLGEQLDVVEIDAVEQPDLARKWGVLSVPTTFVLDRQGKPLHVNHGVTPSDKLLKQVQSVL